MKNLRIEIYLTIGSNFLIFLLLSLLLTGFVQAQSSGSSVMIYPYGKEGTSENGTATTMANMIATELFKRYPCVDSLTSDEVKALIGLERWRQLLGQEPDNNLLQNLAGAIGARYIVSVRASTLPNGQVVVSVSVTDSSTARLIANVMSNDINAGNASTVLVGQLLQDLAGLFKGQCDAHWAGSITFTHLKQVSKNEAWIGDSSGTLIPNVQINQTIVENLEETADILLQAMTLGSSGDSVKSRVSQRYSYHWERIRKENGTTPCREPGRNPFRKEVSGEEKEARDESGQSAETVSVTISVRPTGEYQIKVYKIEPIKTTGRSERSGNIMGCKPNPFSSSGEIQGLHGAGYIDLEGAVDPKHPEFLSGKKIEDTPENGKKIWIWSLRLVKPKTKQ